MTELSADKRRMMAPAVAATGEKNVDSTQDVFARQEDLFTVVSAEDSR